MSLSGNPERWAAEPRSELVHEIRPCECADFSHPLPCPKPAVRFGGGYGSPALCLGCTYGCENDRDE